MTDQGPEACPSCGHVNTKAAAAMNVMARALRDAAHAYDENAKVSIRPKEIMGELLISGTAKPYPRDTITIRRLLRDRVIYEHSPGHYLLTGWGSMLAAHYQGART